MIVDSTARGEAMKCCTQMHSVDMHYLFLLSSDEHTSLCELGPRDPTKSLTSMVPKDQMSVLREIHSGRTSLQDMGKDVCRREKGGGESRSEEVAVHAHYLQSPAPQLATHTPTAQSS